MALSGITKKPGWLTILWIVAGILVARHLALRALSNPGEAGLMEEVTGIIFNVVGIWVLLASVVVLVGSRILKKGQKMF